MKQTTAAILGDWSRCWKQLLLTDVMYKLIAFVLLTPMVSVLFSILFLLSGNTVLADQDILMFLLGPAGWLCLVAMGAVTLAIKALEMAALMSILAVPAPAVLRPSSALRFALAHSIAVLRLTARVVGLVMLTLSPFLLVAGGVYLLLLTDHDINFYLQQKPTEFFVALSIGGVLMVAANALLLRYFVNWFFALPLVLFESLSPRRALRESHHRSVGHRRRVLTWLVLWLSTVMLVSGLATSVVILVGKSVVPRMTGSLIALAITIGVSLLCWWLLNLVVNLIATTSLATILFQLYRRLADGKGVEPSCLGADEISDDGSRFCFTRHRFLAAAMIFALVAGVVGVVFERSVRLPDSTEIIAHRGASALAPENTLAAVRQAIDDGADWVEIDVQETQDGQVVVFHDSDFMKVAGNPLKIWEATGQDLRDIDIGSWFAPTFRDERTPTLAEVLEECRDRIGVTIELKYYGHDQQLEQRVVDIVEACRMDDQIMIMSLKLSAVTRMKSLRPQWPVGLLMSVVAGDLSKTSADFLAVNAAFVDRSFVRMARRMNKRVFVWTVNDPINMSTKIGQGVDGLITDQPAMARRVLEQRRQMSGPERLLVALAGIFGVEGEFAAQ